MSGAKVKNVCPSCKAVITNPESQKCPDCGFKFEKKVANCIDTNFILIFACTIVNIVSCFLKWNNQQVGIDFPVCTFILLPNIILFVFMLFEFLSKIKCCNLLLISVPLISIISIFVGGLFGLDVPYRGGWHNNVISFDYINTGFYMLIISSTIAFISSLLLIKVTINEGRHFFIIEKMCS